MINELLPSLLFIQIPSAIFVYFDSRKRKMADPWLWIIGVAFFMPLFLPFYILLRPRKAYLFCPNCNSKNPFPITNCSACGIQIQSQEKLRQAEWGLLDSITILILSLFVIPVSLAGLSSLLGILEGDWSEWNNIYYFSLIGSASLIILSLWFIKKVCGRPLKDIGLTKERLLRNILIGIMFIVPVLFLEYVAEEAFIKIGEIIAPSQAEHLRELQDMEHKGSIDIWPTATDEYIRFVGVTLLVVILGPIGEEILFRGMIYTSLRQRRGKLASLILSSIFFALVHGQFIHLFPIFLIALILAYLYEHTNSIVSSITLHVSVNLFFMIILYYYPNFYT